MPPQTVTMVIWLLQELIQHEPEIAASIKALFTKTEPTDADWDALHAKVAAKSYRDYVPASALPAAAPTSALPPATAPDSALPAEVPIKILPAPVTDQAAPTAAPSQPASDAPAVTDQAPATPAASQPQQAQPEKPIVTLNAPPPVRSVSMSPIVPPPTAAEPTK